MLNEYTNIGFFGASKEYVYQTWADELEEIRVCPKFNYFLFVNSCLNHGHICILKGRLSFSTADFIFTFPRKVCF
jgi:hypothetical protein